MIIKTITIFLALTILTVGFYSCSQNTTDLSQKKILIVVEDRLVIPLEFSIGQYKSDLKKEGYKVRIKKI